MQAVSESVTLICLNSGRLCIPEGQAKWLVDAIALTSVVAAAGFGLLGLFTDYKNDDNRVTIWGRIAAAGIVGSALLSILLSTLQDRLQSQAETRARLAAEAKRRTDQRNFNRQLRELATVQGDLGIVLGQSRTVRDQLRKSIVTQQTQLGLANRAVADIRSGAEKSERNTQRLLRSVFDAADQVSARDLTVRAALECEFPNRSKSPSEYGTKPGPPAFGRSPELRLTVFEPSPDDSSNKRPLGVQYDVSCGNVWPGSCYTEEGLWYGVSVTHSVGRQPQMRIIPNRVLGEQLAYSQTSKFDELTGNNSALDRREAWNGLELHVRMMGASPEFRALFDDEDMVRPDANGLVDLRDRGLGYLGQLSLGTGEHLLPCRADITVFLRDRLLARGTGQLATVGELITLVLPPLRVAPDTFPTYGR